MRFRERAEPSNLEADWCRLFPHPADRRKNLSQRRSDVAAIDRGDTRPAWSDGI
jgi:hypothetical protein